MPSAQWPSSIQILHHQGTVIILTRSSTIVDDRRFGPKKNTIGDTGDTETKQEQLVKLFIKVLIGVFVGNSAKRTVQNKTVGTVSILGVVVVVVVLKRLKWWFSYRLAARTAHQQQLPHLGEEKRTGWHLMLLDGIE